MSLYLCHQLGRLLLREAAELEQLVEHLPALRQLHNQAHLSQCVYVCVCVCEREIEGERGNYY